MNILFEWEALDAQTLRARVIGGWLVRYHSHSGGVAMNLVPDPDHQWAVEVPANLLSQYQTRLEKLERRVLDPYLDANVKGEVEEEIQTLKQFISQRT
ncbi:MAG: hypothetical protein OEW39_16200 [Deltaproteobacteria bacterium]|nr:hypothetical protein [Deltaproteobacteria bacterium]